MVGRRQALDVDKLWLVILGAHGAGHLIIIVTQHIDILITFAQRRRPGGWHQRRQFTRTKGVGY
jgi:hypothetical protein